MLSQLEALNDKFYDTGIKFCLATRGAGSTTGVPMNPSYLQTQETPGIIHVNHATLSAHTSGSTLLLNTVHNSVKGEKYLRIWIVKSIDGATSPILGYAYFPNATTTRDGIILKYNVCGNGEPGLLPNYDKGETLVHEMGHYPRIVPYF